MKPHAGDSDERRTRSHARALAGHVFLSGGRVFLVRGRPEPARLIDCLANAATIPDPNPTPADLGFAASDVTPIARGSLGTRARSVQRWRGGVEREAAGRLTPTRRRELAEQTAELDMLSARVADLHRLVESPPDGSALYWLSAAEDESLRAMTRRMVIDRVVPAEVTWLARLVRWVGGLPAAERFLTTVRDGLCFPSEVAEREAVVRFRAILLPVVQRLDVLNALPRHQQAAALAECREKSRQENVVARLRRAFEELPPTARGPNRIVLPTRAKEIDCYLLRDRCDTILKEYRSPPDWAKLARLAALYLTDNGSTALTWPAVDVHLAETWTVRVLAEESTKPGYEDLLAHLGSLTFEGPDLNRVRRLFAAGFDVECVNWWGHHLDERLADEADLRALPPVREVVTWLTGRDPALEEYVLAFWESACAPGACPVAESLARFVRWLATPTAQQVGEVAGLVRLLSLPAFRQRLVERLRRWGDPPPRTRLPADCPDGLPADLVALLRRLAFHQAMAGEPVRLPKSLRKPLDAAARTEREVAHLRGLGDGRDARQAARLRHLEARAAGGEDGLSVRRLVRQAREVAAVTALAAAKTVLRDELTAWWRGRFDCDPGLDSFGWRHLHQLMTWADGLSDADRRMVDAVLAAFRDYGPQYRRHLPHNAGWLAHAGAAIDVAAWLAPPPVRRTLADGTAVTVRTAADPREVFLMGSRFATCLRLDRGENRNAVLPNAADANKSVVYVYGPGGEPLARMLVGVAAGWRLIGFEVYESRGDEEEMVRVFGEYCGAWAARAGLTLADDGVLPTLTGGFWYDDRARPWRDAAKGAYQAAGGRTTSAPPPADPSADSTAAVFWQIVRTPSEPVRSWEGVDYGLLLRHLAARGRIPFATDPRTWGPGVSATTPYRGQPVRVRDYLYAEMIWALSWLLPPDEAALRAGVNLLVSIEYEPGDAHSVCFASSPPTPLLGTLPLATCVQLLRRYADWFRVPNCGCQLDARPAWAQVLHAAWRRDGDTRTVVLAAADPRELVRDVLRLVYQIEPIPELGRALRRRLKAAARPEAEAIRATLGDRPVQPDPHATPPVPCVRKPLADIAVDRRRPFPERRTAIEELFGGTNGIGDSALGAELCVSWTAAEREQLALDIRAGLAKSLASDITNGSNWCLWPTLYWVATLPIEEQPDCFIAEEPDDHGVPTRRLRNGYRRLWEHLRWGQNAPPHLAILVQALEHPSAGVRQAARSLYRAAALVDPDWLRCMLDLSARFVTPDTLVAVSAECERCTVDAPSSACRSQG